MSTLRVRASGPLRGTCRVPGDKSISHRALLFGALAGGPVEITGLGHGGDNRSTAGALGALGVAIEWQGERARVRGQGFAGLRAPAGPLDCGNSGTTIRLFAGLLAGRPFSATMIGDSSLTRRPMGRVARPLREMGARIDGRSDPARPGDIYPPLEVQGGRLHGISYGLPVASAQLKSALVLAALQAEGDTELVEPGLSRDHTERMLAAMGAPLVSDPARNLVRVAPGGWSGVLEPCSLVVPGDLSSAAFLIVAALLVPGSDVTVENVGLNPTRTGILDALQAMGADLEIEVTGDAGGEPCGRVRARSASLRGSRVDGALALRSIDEIPALAAAAALAHGRTELCDLRELRVKESDRVAALVRELRRCGVAVEERPDGLAIEGTGGAALRGGEVEAEHDHRIAMTGAVLGLRSPEETVVPADDIATSFPTFASSLAALGANLA